MIKKLPVWLENKVDPVELLFRLIIGGIFIYAGILKVIDINTFELSIRNYKILNDPWVAIVALTLPPLEIITGTCIVFKFLYQGALAVICS
ncbi:MAG: MauE/DoxX family redox-associated membrane protein, partial [Verrucomicrobiota bacterium]|nr:MauE/DoxX family redox-associated membrane protein [Verrucomicrobiota bacterium]